MARGSLSENERQCLETSSRSQVEQLQDTSSEKSCIDMKANGLRVRFVDEESITDRFTSTDEVDQAVSRVKNIHILKNRSSSETSLLLRNPSLTKQKLAERRASGGNQVKSGDNFNNNSSCENLNGKLCSLRVVDFESELIDNKTETSKTEDDTKENDLHTQNFKKNCNVYSVNQAKTLTSERKKSLPLSSIPKLIGHRVSDNLQKPSVGSAEVNCSDDSLLSGKDFTARAIGKLSRGIGKLLRRSNSVKISEPDPVYKVAYLGNVLTGWARGESCIEKPLATLWRNYNQSTKPDVVMKLSITNSGLKGFTKEHGLTEYWSHRITYCASPPHYPKIFCWVYRHEGRKLKHELRCHAVLCTKETISKKITDELQQKLRQALAEFKKDRISKQNARLSLANSVYENPSMPRRKILLSVGATNYRPPLERSKSAPKLGAIEELCSEEDEEEAEMNTHGSFCKNWSRTSLGESDNDVMDEMYGPHSLLRRRSEKVIPARKITHETEKERSKSETEAYSGYSASDEYFSELVPKTEYKITENIDNIVKELSLVNPNENMIQANLVTETNKPESRFSTLECIDETSEILDSVSSHLRHNHKNLQLLAQSNFLVTDSDDGSVSSGCETASTVTSSDEPTSLPCQFPQEDYSQVKDTPENDRVSVFQRIQCFERDIHQRRSNCMGVSHSIQNINNGTELCENSQTASEEVNLIPIGESNAFRRRCTYPPLKNVGDVIGGYEHKFNTLIDNLNDFDSLNSSDDTVFKGNEDNDSACSDESGYSEFVDPSKESVIGTTIMV